MFSLNVMEFERRKYKRVVVSFEVKFFGTQNYGARVSDISLGGCYVETIAYVAVGEVLTLEIETPTGYWLKLRGKVKYVHPNVGFGVSFLQLSKDETDVLESIIEYEAVCY